MWSCHLGIPGWEHSHQICFHFSILFEGWSYPSLSLSLPPPLTILSHSFSFPFYMILHHSCNDAINQPNCFLLICRLQKHNFWEEQKKLREVGSKSCHAFSFSSHGGTSQVYYTIILYISYHNITRNFWSRMEEQFRIIFNIATSSLSLYLCCLQFSQSYCKSGQNIFWYKNWTGSSKR